MLEETEISKPKIQVYQLHAGKPGKICVGSLSYRSASGELVSIFFTWTEGRFFTSKNPKDPGFDNLEFIVVNGRNLSNHADLWPVTIRNYYSAYTYSLLPTKTKKD